MRTPKPKVRAATAEPATEPRIEYVRLSDLKVAKRNPKEHDIAAIKAAILRYGMVAPIIEDAATGRIVAGHGRKEALEAIKAETPGTPPARVRLEADGEWSVPIIRGIAFKNEKLAEEYLVADNRLVEIGGWNQEIIGEIMGGIAKRGVEALAAVGWSEVDVASMLKGWDSDITAIQKHGSNTDGIAAKFSVFCPQPMKDDVGTAVMLAVKKFGDQVKVV